MKWVVLLFTYQTKAEYLDKEESYYSSTKEGTVYCNFNLSLRCNKKALDKISFHKNTLKGFERFFIFFLFQLGHRKGIKIRMEYIFKLLDGQQKMFPSRELSRVMALKPPDTNY